MRRKSEEVKRNKRLRAIKLKPVLFEKECKCCGDFISREKMYCVDRWRVNRRVSTWYYCQECMHSKEDVLHEIDTDKCPFGIAYVDRF